jgi:D-alanyl-lipoteichoic acid acyltransferase DltB (MBOAT superfamily)
LHYILFVSYFPHLVAGPILHHKEMMPQFNLKHIYRFNMNDFLLGISLFSAGLFKKVVFADNLSGYADAVFNSADAGTALTATQAWCGAISYSLQLYFDFSGYSDMAIGLARMVGIRFPLNFFSPYRATSVIEFWRRWHMTLSRFLRDYLYIPLGGNRRGPVLRYVNLLITMVIGGLWHGASWNFIFWGGLHGAALIGNHLWRNLTARWGILTPAIIGQTATLLIVVWAWVPFRAHSLAAALSIWHDMLGLSGLFGAVTWNEIIVLFGLSAIALLTPNTAQLFLDEKRQRPAFSGLRWRSSMAWSIALGAALGIAISSSFTHPSAFLYFRF